MKRIPAEHLRVLRSAVHITAVICDLDIPTRKRGSRWTIRCPQCRAFHSRVNRRSNLSYCFSCRQSFNPIDLVMAERGWSFLQAVEHLRRCLHAPE